MQCLHLINRRGGKSWRHRSIEEKCQKKSKYFTMCKSTNFYMNHFLIVAFTMAATVNFTTFQTQVETKQRGFLLKVIPLAQDLWWKIKQWQVHQLVKCLRKGASPAMVQVANIFPAVLNHYFHVRPSKHRTAF